MTGTFIALDLILFFIFWEIVLVPMYFMIGIWGGSNRQYAAVKFFLYTLFGSIFMLLGFLALRLNAGTFDIVELAEQGDQRVDGVPEPRVRRPRARVRDQGADVAVPHVAPGRPYRGADRRLRAPGGHHAEDGDLRLHPYRVPDPSRRGAGLRSRHRDPRRDRDHLRSALLLRPDGPETTDRVLVGRSHGLRDARHRDAYAEPGSTARSSGWSLTDSSPACCSSSPARSTSATTRERSRSSGECSNRYRSSARSSRTRPSLRWDCPAWPGSGARCWRSSVPTTRPPGSSEPLFRVLMVGGGIGTVLTAGYLLWTVQRVNLGRVPEKFAGKPIFDVTPLEWVAWAPLLAPDRRRRTVPEDRARGHRRRRPGPHQRGRRLVTDEVRCSNKR